MMNRKTRVYGVVAAGAVLALSLSACRPATPPRNPIKPADFKVSQIGAQPGAAFTVVGELAGGLTNQEVLTTSFNFSFGPFGPSPAPGSVTMYQNVGGTYAPTTVVSTAEGIKGPNQPTIADVNGDGRNDFILPSGWFFNVATGGTTGSITWWENNGDGTFTRHDIINNVAAAYHGVVYTDFDRDGIKDIVTTAEDGGFPAWPFAGPPIAPNVKTQFFKGTGGGNFAAPVTLCNCGGSLPVVFDINQDGKYDIATAQYFKVKSSPIPPFGITNESFIWLENTANTGDALDSTKFVKHVIASGLGESFQILAVDNLDGDGKYGAIGVNHVNPALGPSAPPQVVRFTPGADIRAPWTVSPVADGFPLNDNRAGQSAPGSTSEGDLDGDGDIDLAVAGDANWGIYWLERKADGTWVKHNVADEYGTPGTNWGQGSVAVADLNRDGKNELVFSSYNAGTVNVVERKAATGGIVPAVPHIPDPLMPY